MGIHPLQTAEWGNFREEWGNKVRKFSGGLIIFSNVPHTKFKIGTVLKSIMPTKKLVDELKRLGNEENAIFIKLEPNILYDQKLEKNLLSLNFIKGKTLFTPTSFWIDLKKTEDDLLKSFSSKTRYNIRLAQKRGVEVKIDNSEKTFERYLDLTFETAGRQGFYAHTKRYHRLMWKHLNQEIVKKGQKPIANLLIAKYKKEIISAWILFAKDNFLYYPYGASTDKYKEVMANNLMMWEAIKFGKSLDLATFDLWGREEGKGFTKFKEGYNPQVVKFLGSWDLVINKPLYYIYRVAEKLRWFMLRLRAKS